MYVIRHYVQGLILYFFYVLCKYSEVQTAGRRRNQLCCCSDSGDSGGLYKKSRIFREVFKKNLVKVFNMQMATSEPCSAKIHFFPEESKKMSDTQSDLKTKLNKDRQCPHSGGLRPVVSSVVVLVSLSN